MSNPWEAETHLHTLMKQRHMTVIENQTTVARTPEEVFDFSVDLRDERSGTPPRCRWRS